MKTIIGLFTLTLILSCGGSNESVGLPGLGLGEGAKDEHIANFLTEYDNWDDGSSLPSEVVKIDTEKGGFWVVVKHTYSGTSPFEGDRPLYVAYNLEGYEEGNIDNFINGSVDGFSDAVSSDVYLEFNNAEIPRFIPSWDAFYSSGSSDRMGTYTPIEEEDRNLWIFETSGTKNKDLEKVGAKIEGIQIEGLKYSLTSFGLSADKSEDMAQLAYAYNKIKEKRALTEREKDNFSMALLGMSFSNASTTLVEEGHDALINKAVEIHEISPEAVKEILNLL